MSVVTSDSRWLSQGLPELGFLLHFPLKINPQKSHFSVPEEAHGSVFIIQPRDFLTLTMCCPMRTSVLHKAAVAHIGFPIQFFF